MSRLTPADYEALKLRSERTSDAERMFGKLQPKWQQAYITKKTPLDAIFKGSYSRGYAVGPEQAALDGEVDDFIASYTS